MVSRMDRMEAGTLATLLLLTGAGVTGLLRVMLTPSSSLWLKMDKNLNLKKLLQFEVTTVTFAAKNTVCP